MRLLVLAAAMTRVRFAAPAAWRAPESLAETGRALQAFAPGDAVEYLSASYGNKWISATVLEVKATGELMLDVKRGVWLSANDVHTKVRIPGGAAAPPRRASRGAADEIAKDEIAKWKEQPAVRQVWRHSYKVTDFAGTPEEDAVKAMLTHEIPGLRHVTFGEVFTAFEAGGCPVWLVGGTVRDIVAGLKPNDVDTAILCDTRVAKRICTRKGWRHLPGDSVDQPYFNVGIAHGDNEEYLEGFSVDLVMSDPFTPETSVNMLFWSVQHSVVIDPSGKGVEDAKGQVLRPAAPPKRLIREASTWRTWRQWVLGQFAGHQNARHNRYLKMRMRGWTPVEEALDGEGAGCFRFFMANQLATMWPMEVSNPEEVVDRRTMMALRGDPQPVYPAATLLFLAEKLEKMSKEKAKAFLATFLDVAFAELDFYYAKDAAWARTCTTSGRIAKASRAAAQSTTALLEQTLIGACETPSMHMRMLAHGSRYGVDDVDFGGLCTLLLSAYDARTSSGPRRASSFSLAARAPVQVRRHVARVVEQESEDSSSDGPRDIPMPPNFDAEEEAKLLQYLERSWKDDAASVPAVPDPPKLVHLIDPDAEPQVQAIVDRNGRLSGWAQPSEVEDSHDKGSGVRRVVGRSTRASHGVRRVTDV